MQSCKSKSHLLTAFVAKFCQSANISLHSQHILKSCFIWGNEVFWCREFRLTKPNLRNQLVLVESENGFSLLSVVQLTLRLTFMDISMACI